ncbi:hypothetical protein RCH10_003793 [Variovorax sp. GrIS 2.14]|uniref:hypothetical protein n=1 Tax=Variovorax sp. GrIS 2.14 TaxID=3071709 RepID=UPI0038F6BEAB
MRNTYPRTASKPHARYNGGTTGRGRVALGYLLLCVLAALASLSIVTLNATGSLGVVLSFFWYLLGSFGFLSALGCGFRMTAGSPD